jgi:hypothetical protein
MEGDTVDLVGPEGIIVVSRGNIEHRAERVASWKNACFHGYASDLKEGRNG